MNIEDIYNKYVSDKQNLLNKQIELQSNLENLENNFKSDLNCLIGKCFSNTLKTYNYARAYKSDYRRSLDKLLRVFQIIGIEGDVFVIQNFEERINNVAPSSRLTYYQEIFKTSDIVSLIQSSKEISITEYLETIKEMKDRDSYPYYYGSLVLK